MFADNRADNVFRLAKKDLEISEFEDELVQRLGVEDLDVAFGGVDQITVSRVPKFNMWDSEDLKESMVLGSH